MSKLLYLVSGRRPTFSLGCQSPTGSRISSPEVVTRMWETVRNAQRWAAEGETWRCAAFCGRRDVVDRSNRPTAAAAERLPTVVMGATELLLPPPGHARRSSSRLRTCWVSVGSHCGHRSWVSAGNVVSWYLCVCRVALWVSQLDVCWECFRCCFTTLMMTLNLMKPVKLWVIHQPALLLRQRLPLCRDSERAAGASDGLTVCLLERRCYMKHVPAELLIWADVWSPSRVFLWVCDSSLALCSS